MPDFNTFAKTNEATLEEHVACIVRHHTNDHQIGITRPKIRGLLHEQYVDADTDSERYDLIDDALVTLVDDGVVESFRRDGRDADYFRLTEPYR